MGAQSRCKMSLFGKITKIHFEHPLPISPDFPLFSTYSPLTVYQALGINSGCCRVPPTAVLAPTGSPCSGESPIADRHRRRERRFLRPTTEVPPRPLAAENSIPTTDGIGVFAVRRGVERYWSPLP